MQHDINCDACEAWADAYLDDELDAATAGLVNAHLKRCAACRSRYEEADAFTTALRRNAPRFTPPRELAEDILLRIRDESKTDSRKSPGRAKPTTWFHREKVGLSAAAIAMALTLYVFVPMPSDRLADEVVSSHVRSLMEHHLTDVESSDKHTVKPWFTGRLDYSPPVTDFASDGYALVGGRLDYLEERTVGALSYRHGKHLINVFILPDESPEHSLRTQTRRGYNIASWTKNHMTFYAISDMQMDELKHFSQLLLDVHS